VKASSNEFARKHAFRNPTPGVVEIQSQQAITELQGPIMADIDERGSPSLEPKPAEAPRVVDARRLFEGQREIWIEHEGVRYRLRLTRRNKLILQK
jgi:hemin uptake protein HemP